MHKLFSLFFFLPLDKYFVSLLFVFVGILFLQSRRARALSLTTGLAARIWCSHFWELTSISGWETEALLQKGTAGQGRLRPGECMELAATCSWDLILVTANQRFREREKELASKYFALLNFSFEKSRFPNQDSELENKISHRIKKQYGGKKKNKLFWKVIIKLYHKTFASCKSSFKISWWAPKLWKNMKKNIVYSVFWGLWLGHILDNPRTNVDFYGSASEHVFSLLSYKMLASLRLLLWFFMDSPRPGILDIWPSVSMVYHLCQFSFPRQLGKKTFLIPRQDQSTAKLWVCSRGCSRWKKRAHHMPRLCVFPFLQQCLLLFIKDYIPFSARYPRLRKKALDGLMNCLAYWMIYLVFLTKWEVSTDLRWGVGSVFLAKGKLLKCHRALQSTAWRRPHERVFSKTFLMSPLVHWLLIQNVDVMV